MITTPKGLLRNSGDAILTARVLEWMCKHERSAWFTMAEAAENTPLNVEQISRLWHEWERVGWLVKKNDSGRLLWRATVELPIVSRREKDARLSWSAYFSALIELPIR